MVKWSEIKIKPYVDDYLLNKSIGVEWFHSCRTFTWSWLVISVLKAKWWYHSSTNLRLKTILFWNPNDVFFGRTKVWNMCHVVILGNLRRKHCTNSKWQIDNQNDMALYDFWHYTNSWNDSWIFIIFRRSLQGPVHF